MDHEMLKEAETMLRETVLSPQETLGHLRVSGQALLAARARGSIKSINAGRRPKYAYPPAEVAKWILSRERFDGILDEYREPGASPARRITAATGLAHAILRAAEVFEVDGLDRNRVILVLTRAGVAPEDAWTAWEACGMLARDIDEAFVGAEQPEGALRMA